MKKLMNITVKGDRHDWGFSFYGDPKHIEDWLADGLDVTITENTCPEWAVRLGWHRAWFRAQDIFNFKWGR